MSPPPIGDGRGDPVEAAAAVMAKAERLLVEGRQARIALAAAAESPERRSLSASALMR